MERHFGVSIILVHSRINMARANTTHIHTHPSHLTLALCPPSRRAEALAHFSVPKHSAFARECLEPDDNLRGAL